MMEGAEKSRGTESTDALTHASLSEILCVSHSCRSMEHGDHT